MSAVGQPAVPTGNTYDKYGSSNPLVKRLMSGFDHALDELWEIAKPRSLLDVGCGEGVLTSRWAERLGDARVVGVDLDDPKLRAEWDMRRRPNLEFRAHDARALPFADGEFDTVAAVEVLEHVSDPDQALAEMARVSSRWLLVSVPREPVWRMLNLARGAYLSSLGNSPGHLHHWTQVGFKSLLTGHGTIEEVRAPLPWTVLLVRVDAG